MDMGHVLSNPWVWGAGGVIVLLGLTRGSTSSSSGTDVVAASAQTAIASQQAALANAQLNQQTVQMNNAATTQMQATAIQGNVANNAINLQNTSDLLNSILGSSVTINNTNAQLASNSNANAASTAANLTHFGETALTASAATVINGQNASASMFNANVNANAATAVANSDNNAAIAINAQNQPTIQQYNQLQADVSKTAIAGQIQLGTWQTASQNYLGLLNAQTAQAQAKASTAGKTGVSGIISALGGGSGIGSLLGLLAL